MEDLKPCPFCGGGNINAVDGGGGVFSVKSYVECKDCHAFIFGETYEKAITAWNTRAERTERTCSNSNTEKPYSIFFRCSYCGYPNKSAIDAQILAADVNYCQNCGAKVVD